MQTRTAPAGIFAAALLISGCAQAGPTQQSGAPEAAQIQQAAVENPAACVPGKEVWRSPGPPKRGGTLVRGADLFEHMDMTKGGRTSNSAMPQVYNTLVQYRGCFASDTVMVPSLAASWQVSSDGKTWTLQLRQDVKWQNLPPVNGRGFTSADVAWMIEEQKRGGVLQSYWQDVAHEEPDPHTVVLRTAEAQADFLGKVGAPTNLMMPREIKEQYGDFRTVAVGTGAFMVKEFKPVQGELVVEPNPSYYDKGDDGQPLPYVSQVRAVAFADYTAQLAALRAGQIDSTSTFGLRKLDADALRQTGLRPWDFLAFAPQSLWFNLTRKPWDSTEVRKAVGLAIDQEDLIAVNRGGATYTGYIPPSLVEYAWPQEKLKQKFKPDPERAKRLLAELGVSGTGRELDLKTCTAGAEEAEVVQKQLAAVGLPSKLEVIAGACSPVQEKLDYDVAWTGVTGVPFPGYWVNDFVRTGSSRNSMKLSDPQVDALGKAQEGEMDPVKRKQIIEQAQERLYEVFPYHPAITRVFYHAVSCRVRNYVQMQPAYNPPSAVNAWIDPTGC